ncbi:polyamine aminopropyltransferase [Ruminococcus sp.]|uniref:polyamine aminopropyltransferase n=2 Tax=Ruminococcus sp. TaxID=41978 RepID=UPI0025EE4563|nr:polyamine aminopropyltransferase [Ruminococcus sp.]MCI5815703.1 polyamine aminopropyltransferase [Ruminococcus sp.]MDD7556409.1 polyamine aminopropyltransferase [Ruminococcus sp.]MDY4964412.1 polyamine aminopropyltransferase [Ruminococcus callidus]
MALWFTEQHTDDVRFSIHIKEQLYSGKSYYQQIEVFDSYEFGRVLVLDGYIMLTEKDEYIYHEMMVHVPMACNPSIQRVLVIGAGDGGTVRELCRYDSITQIDMVEIDEQVVKVCKEYLPQTACRLEDPRVHIYYEDGLKFVRRVEDTYDLIIVDSTDPFGPGEGLFTKEFYGNCFTALRENGILTNQHESTYYDSYTSMVSRTHRRMRSVFPVAMVYQAHIPTYPSGHWLFGFASKNIHPVYDFKPEAWEQLGLETKYYNTQLHTGCFALPNTVREVLEHA